MLQDMSPSKEPAGPWSTEEAGVPRGPRSRRADLAVVGALANRWIEAVLRWLRARGGQGA
jgi:hypothetical protein